jgi:hypothetical protein
MDVIWWIIAFIGAVIVNLLASELFVWSPPLSEWITRRAVRRLAPDIRSRMEEEWTAHLQTIPAALWRIVAAAGFYLAVRQINVAVRVRDGEIIEIAQELAEIMDLLGGPDEEVQPDQLKRVEDRLKRVADRLKTAKPETLRFLRTIIRTARPKGSIPTL